MFHPTRAKHTGHFLAGLLLALFFLLPARQACAADAETRAYNSAVKAFQDGFADRSQREFADFIQKYPNSQRLPEAILLQARSVFACTNVNAAMNLLTSNLPRSGTLADQYCYWLGQMKLESRDYAGAAENFAQLLKNYPNSSRKLEAAYNEAMARFLLQDWPRTVSLLQQPDGAFQQAAKSSTDTELVSRGQLLLAEALFKQQDLKTAEAIVRLIPTNSTQIAWPRQFLLCRILLDTNRRPQALAQTSNLLALAAGIVGQPQIQAESLMLQGSILEQLKRFDAAAATYEKAQADNMPAVKRQEALLKLAEMMLAQNNLSGAAQRVEKYLTAHPEEASSDAMLLMLGEMRLKEHLASINQPAAASTNAPATPVTNLLQQALFQLDQLIQKYPQSPHVGQAWLDRGWGLLLDGKTVESEAAFKMAAEKLPFSVNQAVARFKLADTQFQENNFTNALAGYRKIIEDYGGLPRVRTGLFDRTWYQIARACIKLGDLQGASNAVSVVLSLYPSSSYAERISLLFGQELSQTNKPSDARVLFTEFERKFTNSTLMPEVQLAIAHTHEMDGNWPAAIKVYDAFLARNPTNRLMPDAAFRCALAMDMAGKSTNAYARFTNFLARFPTNDYAPRAQNWLGDYHYRNEDYHEAERNYQRLFQNYPASDLRFPARFKAGRAAFMRQNYDDAADYYLSLINDKLCTNQSVLAETFFAYGDALVSRPLPAGNSNALKRFEIAMESFRKIPQLYTNSSLVPRAYGRIADCYMQLAAQQDPRYYTNAMEYYELAMNEPRADTPTRNQAETGLAHVLLRQAQLTTPPDAALMDSALNHYLNVVYGAKDDAPTPFWIKEAGLAAGKLLESRKDWPRAIKIYSRLQDVLPALRPTLQKKITQLRELSGP